MHLIQPTIFMRRSFLVVFSIALFLIASHAFPAGAAGPKKPSNQWVGVVTHVTDGDTLWVRKAGATEPVKIRIEGVDAPEICQAYGDVSRRALEGRVLHQVVVVQTRRHDGYGRVLARLVLHGDDVGGWLVAQGHAWSSAYRRDAGPYATQQAHAKAARRGLFADARAQVPRDFRKRHGSCQP